MASLTLRGLNDRFPEGTSLTIRPRSNYGSSTPPVPGQAPLGSATDTQTVSGDAVTFVNLTDDTAYVVTDSGGTKYLSTGTQVSHGGVVHTDSSGNLPGSLVAGLPAFVTDKAYGGIADAVKTTGTVTALGATVTLTSGSFTSADVGKVVVVGGAGATVNLGATNGGTAVPRPVKGWIASVASGVASLVTAKGGSTPVSFVTSQTDTSIAYGTNLYDALVLARATGRAIEIPAGDYIFVGTLTGTLPRLYGAGHKTRIYISSDHSQILPTAGTGLTGSSKTLASNVAAGATSITLSSALATIAPGDILYLSSTATWETGSSDTDATQTTKGEFVRVQQIVGGTTVYLEAPVVDSYTTATTAKVQEYSFTDGLDISGMRFVNATPNVYTYGASSPFSLSQYGGFGTSGNGGLIEAMSYRNVRLSQLEFEECSGAHILLENCVDFDVSRCKTLDSSRLGSFGYTVAVFACQWGEVTNCRARRSTALFNAEGVLTSLSIPASMPTRFVEVKDSVAHEGQHEPFLTHVTAEYIDFVDCRIFGGAFYQTETSHSSGFRVYGRNCKLIDPVAESVAGTAIAIGGPGCEVHNPVIRKVVANSVKSRGIDLLAGNPNATGVIIRSADIDGVAMNGSNAEGHGIAIADGCTARIIGRNEVRNVDGYGVYDQDSTEATVIDGLDGINHGHASYGSTPYLIKHDGAGATPVYRNVRLTSVRNAAVRVTDQTGAMDNRYKLFTASGTVIIPDGVTKVRARLVGGGGGGGGAGSASGAQLQAGGGGGAGGHVVELEVAVIPGETLTVAVGAGGAGGGGGAAGGNTGVIGQPGASTTLTNAATAQLGLAIGGSAGNLSGATSTTNGTGGLWGAVNTQANVTPLSGYGGSGAVNGGPPAVLVLGGGGGGAATATLGGGGGSACLAANALTAQGKGANGASGTSAGVNGVTATKPGCGGGGGGGGAAGTGAGGSGGTGADGLVELWW